MKFNKLKNLPLNIILGYLALLGIIIFAGWKLYTENALFFKINAEQSYDESKLTTLSNLQHKIAVVERFARNTIYSTNPDDLETLNLKIDTLLVDIKLAKQNLTNFSEVILLDTVSSLIKQKSTNVASLQSIRNLRGAEQDVNFAIQHMTTLEEQYRKLKIEDFVEDPNKLENYQRDVIDKMVTYLNQNIPDDHQNTISQKKMDSILATSKKLLNQVKYSNEKKSIVYESEEKKLLENEKAISDKIQKVFITVENAIIYKNILEQGKKVERFKEVNNQISLYAIIALVITAFFMGLNVLDYIRSQRYKKELEIANNKANYLLKSREQLISTVSHDLKSPIAAIGGYGEILSKTSLNAKQLYYIDNIIKSSDYLANLANDLASLTLIEAGKIKLETSPFSINKLLVETAQSIQSIYPSKPIELIYNFDRKLDQNIISDPYRLRQIATNLIGNAYKFTTSGNIIIGSEMIDENFIRFYVKDTGIGIKTENLDAVFKEFTQADNTIEKRYGGTGLGLTISKKIAEILGGEIELESNYGSGSCFTVKIQYKEFSEKIAKNSFPIENTILKKLKAVVVDDDEQILTLLKEILNKEDIEVFTFSTVREAIAEIDTILPNFILTDIQMPEQTGFDLIKLLKHNFRTKHIPVIALTGNTDAEKTIYKNAGFSALLSKPFSISTIINSIHKLLNDPNTFVINNKHLDAKKQEFDLTSISEFLNNDSVFIKEFLEKTKQNNETYISDLKRFIKAKDIQGIKGLVHKMSSIFKQVEHKEIITLLSAIENETDFNEIKLKVSRLENKIETFFKQVL